MLGCPGLVCVCVAPSEPSESARSTGGQETVRLQAERERRGGHAGARVFHQTQYLPSPRLSARPASRAVRGMFRLHLGWLRAAEIKQQRVWVDMSS